MPTHSTKDRTEPVRWADRGRGTDDDVDSPEWRRARERMADVRTVVGDNTLTGGLAAVLSQRWGVTTRTVWRRVQKYRAEGGISAFLDRPPGIRLGTKGLSSDAEAIVRECARKWWRQTENATIAEIFPTIVGECRARGLAAPSRATVARRLAALRADPSNFTGEAKATLSERRRLVKASYTVAQALAVVQIDHTVADVLVVDPITRECIGRPTLTVAIDVATRSILGCCLSLEAPSALLVALCLEHAVFPKTEWLASIGVRSEWPMHGQPIALHTDNGREFHSAGFRRGCDLHGIDTIYRPPGTPRFGGHVERLIGTLMRRVRLLPGRTYSDLLGARPSRAENRAAMTLADLRGFLAEDVERYHDRSHRTLGTSPRHAWDRAWSGAVPGPRVPADPLKFWRDFLPAQRRVVGREGIELFRLKYSCEALEPEVSLGVARVVRFDPRDITRVYLERADASLLAVPLRDPTIPAMSLWEWKAVCRAQREVAEQPDGERVREALARPAASRQLLEPTRLRVRRRAARAEEWKAVQAIAALPAPDVALEPTMNSNDVAGSFAWEVLE